MKTRIRFHLYMALCIVMLVSFSVYAQSSGDVKIGSQIWMSKNLDVDRFRNGDKILYAKNKDEYVKACQKQLPAYTYYQFDEINGRLFGKLYNVYAVNDNRQLSPVGYHIPSQSEFIELQLTYGDITTEKITSILKSDFGWLPYNILVPTECQICNGYGSVAGDPYKCLMKCTNCKGPQEKMVIGNGSNSSGFEGLPGGYISGSGFADIGKSGFFWCSTTSYSKMQGQCNYYFLLSNTAFLMPTMTKLECNSTVGYSVRCIKNTQ